MFALTNSEIAARCPQVFQTNYSKARTKKYGQYTTAQVIEALRTEGYEVTNAFSQARIPGQFSKHCVRLSHRDFLDTLHPDETRPEIVIVNSHDGSSSFRIMAGIARIPGQFSKHCVRLSHRDFLDTLHPDETRPEIVIVNSHDGSSSFRIMAGIFRLVCSNGLIIADETTADNRICHWKGNSFDSVINTALLVAEQAKQSYELIDQMKAQNLTPQQQKDYATKAAKIRLAYNKKSQVNFAENLLIPHRHEDNITPSIWNTYNVVQENCIKGGQLVGSRVLRPLTNISQNVEVNRKLWQEAVALIA